MLIHLETVKQRSGVKKGSSIKIALPKEMLVERGGARRGRWYSKDAIIASSIRTQEFILQNKGGFRNIVLDGKWILTLTLDKNVHVYFSDTILTQYPKPTPVARMQYIHMINGGSDLELPEPKKEAS